MAQTRTVLQLATSFCERMGLPIPAALVGVTEIGTVQLRAILTETIRHLAEYKWPELTTQITFQSSSSQIQGLVSQLAFGGTAIVPPEPSDQPEQGLSVQYISSICEIVPGTLWDETLRQPLNGPLTETQRTQLQVIEVSGGLYNYWVDRGVLNIFPNMPETPHTMRMTVRYDTPFIATDGDGYLQDYITSDDNLCFFPDRVVSKGLEWRWRKMKGEPYEVDYNEYMTLLARAISRSTGGVTRLSMNTQPETALRPGIFVPSGSWPVSGGT